ncbi:hypothetical protein LCGC14_2563120 [marine sediment metagenome]|uniref:TET-Associated Glycosyltransferase domain-containing protein n=1 Tax=marine sediment metagenome TaxID=412755 RepID=A0A0F9B7G1_9ZZZZ
MNMPYHIVIEPQEYLKYASVIDSKKILRLPFMNLGQGSIPARNWVWEHSLSIGAERHWILDDNIAGFVRLNRNTKISVDSGTIFKCAEDFTDRYENVALSGFNYRYFASQRQKQPPFRLNTRIYSIILVNNKLKHRWRGRYNEDTDLSLRVLKDGWCTILFQAFLANKIATMTMSGGNTDEVYVDGDERLKFAQSLQKQHPDVTTIVRRYNRWHHHVNYEMFKYNKLIKRQGITIQQGVNDYGMILKSL